VAAWPASSPPRLAAFPAAGEGAPLIEAAQLLELVADLGEQLVRWVGHA